MTAVVIRVDSAGSYVELKVDEQLIALTAVEAVSLSRQLAEAAEQSGNPAGRRRTRCEVLPAARASECDNCGDDGPLELHTSEWPGGRDEPTISVAYCRTCHQDAHTDLNGEFWFDAEQKRHHWEPYFHALDKDD